MKQDFRSDIEGLRAVAVLLILIFHLNPAWCPGGFIGVDIFFSISGYLITRMIVAEGVTFKFVTFYTRRFFRLFPALLATLIGTLIAGWTMLGPSQYETLALSTIAAYFGLSNIFFFLSLDYFSANGLAHPLLHTWSLGVEEQFYLLWPVLLVFTQRLQLHLSILIFGMAAISLVATVTLQAQYPELAFYMMPFRIFEFAIGAAAWRVQGMFKPLTPVAGQLAGFAGSALLIAPAFLLHTNTPWPSLWSLAPALAVALLILGPRDSISARLLSSPPLRLIGRLSYSLYLAHWPIIVFYRHLSVTPPNSWELALLAAGSVAAALALHVLVEAPFRQRGAHQPALTYKQALWRFQPFSRRVLTVFVALASGVCISAAALIAATGGLPSRLENSQVQFTDKGLTFAGDLCSFKRSRCVIGDSQATKIVYIIGDSLAMNLLHGLDRVFRDSKIKGIVFHDFGCLYFFDTTRFTNGTKDSGCGQNVAEAYAHLATVTEPVILAGDYAGHRNDIGDLDAVAPLRQTQEEYYQWLQGKLSGSLKALGVDQRKIVIIKQTYSTGIDLPKCLSSPAAGSSPAQQALACAPLTREAAFKLFEAADKLIDNAVEAFPTLITIDPKALFCKSDPCVTRNGSELYFRDPAHLTNAGSDYLVEQFRELLVAHLAAD